MKYRKTVVLKRGNITEDMQCGQWIRWHDDAFKSRYVGVSPAGVVYVSHAKHDRHANQKHFKSYAKLFASVKDADNA